MKHIWEKLVEGGSQGSLQVSTPLGEDQWFVEAGLQSQCFPEVRLG